MVKTKLLACSLLLVACTPYSISGPVSPAPVVGHAGVATVCVVRSSPWARGVTFVVHDNQTLVGAVKGDSYFCYEAAPGAHEIVSDTFDSTDHPGRTQIALAPDTRYFLLQDHDNRFGSITSKLLWIEPERGAQLVASADYRVVTEVPGHEHVPPPIPFAPAR